MKPQAERYALIFSLIVLLLAGGTASAASTEVHIVKLADDGITILNETTVTYQWMEANLPVYGDGVTHYYHQGPVFIDDPDPAAEEELRWNPEEDTNVLEKDMGAVRGSNLEDLCDLVGGMSPGDTLRVKASDGFTKWFAFENVYLYSDREGPMIICWNKDGQYPDEGYSDGMRLVWFADNSTNPWGVHAFGNWDWHEAADPAYYYYYYNGMEAYPTTTGLSVQKVSEVTIFSTEPAPVNVIYDGTITLGEGNFTWVDGDGASHEVPNLTPHGALEAAFLADSFSYGGGWSGSKNTALIDWIDDGVTNYTYDDSATPKLTWNYQLNGVYQNYFSSTTGISNNMVIDGDSIEFYYGPDQETTENATAVIRIAVEITEPSAPVNVIFDGTVSLSDGNFTWVDTDGISHEVANLTPHGALEAAFLADSFSYGGGWSGSKNTALIDWIDDGATNYTYDDSVTPKLTWNYQLNGVYQNYFSSTTGISNNMVTDGDYLEFYYGPDQETTGNATAVIRITVDIPEPPPEVNVIYEGTVTLAEGNFTWVDSGGVSHEVANLTPHGALEAALLSDGFTYGGGWSGSKSTALIDWIDDGATNYTYDESVTPKLTWNYQLNGVYQNYFSSTTGISNNMVTDGDYVEFYYGPDQETTGNGTAAIRITVDIPELPPEADILFDGDVTLVPGTFDFIAYNSDTSYQIDSLTPHGALDSASKIAGFDYNASDKKWATMATMLLDDVGDYRYDSSVSPKLCWAYQVNGVWKNDFSSTEGISVYRLNDGDLVEFYYGGSGDTIENATAIIRILVHINEPDVLFDGDVTLLPGTFTFTAYNSGLEYEINTTTPQGALDAASDSAGFVYNATDKKWSTLGTMLLDDIGDYRYNGSVTPKLVWAYAVNGVMKDDFSSTEGISVYELQNNDRVEYFYGKEGDTLSNATAVVRTRVHISSTENWTLLLKGAQTVVIDKDYFEEGVACIHSANYTDLSGTWQGMPLWDLVGYVDDASTHGPGAFNDTLAAEGYQVKITAADGYNVTFNSTDIARNDDYIIANTLDGQPLLEQHWPLKLVGPAIVPMQSVSKISEIELIGIEPIEPAVEVRIIKYGSDGVTIISETTVSVDWMKANLDVIGDGTTVYKFQGITNDPDDLWSPEDETKGGFKIANAVKGTRVKDLCELVGGMGSGTDITFIANDGYETTLPYSSIYTNPAVQARQGDAILAWYADGNEVPDYADGIRLFFTPEDTIFGQWDMHETLAETYWHYYYDSATATMYPSCAGLSAKWITTIRIYSAPETGWNLELDGTGIGGMNSTISKNYFEQALVCQFGSNHQASYTDSQGRVWEGMPLWFLAGFVDDQDQHSDQAFNNTLALAGYDIIVEAGDGYSATIPSEDVIRNSNYIVANTLNGTPIPESESSWPLRLVGQNVTGGLSIRNIAAITLLERPPAGPDADFSATPTEGRVPLGVRFSDLSTDEELTSWYWNFGDGSTSTLRNPTHYYVKPGTYTVSLTVSGVDGSDTETKTGYIFADTYSGVPDGAGKGPQAIFSASPLSGTAPLTVTFTDRSTGDPDSWSWDFGDGTTSAEQNPVHTYTTSGKCLAKLTVQNEYGSSSSVTIIQVFGGGGPAPPVPGKGPQAIFSASPLSGTAPLVVTFTDRSTGDPDSWSWDFGDGTTSTDQNPVHTFTSSGKYLVKLIVQNSDGSSSTVTYIQPTGTIIFPWPF